AAIAVNIPQIAMDFPQVPQSLVEDIPREPAKYNGKSDSAVIQQKRNNGLKDYSVYGYILLVFISIIFYMTIAVRVTGLMISRDYGNATNGSNVLAFVGIGAMSAGFLFGKVYPKTKEYTIAIAFLIMGLSFFLIGLSEKVWVTTLAAMLCGFSFRTFIPYVFNKVNSAKGISTNFATALLLVAFNLGTAISPYGIRFLEMIFSVNTPQTIFFIEGSLLIIFSVIGFLVMSFYKSKAIIRGW
ncbi:MAG TPA: MFS transporter, partial [Epulopiscium sp.]|nr:MFS transporter [Candidatus Epulonipiscium sp.]